MGKREGARRIRKVGKWIALPPLFVSLLLVLTAAVCQLFGFPWENFLNAIPFLAFAVQIAVFGGLLWLVGWIIEGFGTDSES